MDLTGSKVRLRAVTEADADFFAATLVDPEVVRFLASWAWLPYWHLDLEIMSVFRDHPLYASGAPGTSAS